ncbi:hypothetical protein [Bacillus safensis]|uniref:hypothetical protein n=1 Tax=Bacillus safensis TaxID=561879 RepID=UPI0020CCC518|nr:hypothetical protein [Bacillus safensis]MCP9283589.1 hypothetical protein [Bacillus safensis]
MDSTIINRLKTNKGKIEKLKEHLFELEIELIGAEITYKNRNTVIIHVDWENDCLLLNVDDSYEEWVSFK